MDHWWATFSVSALASVLAVILAILLAVTSIRFRIADIVLRPVVAASQSFPLQAIAPIIIIAFGVGLGTKVAIAFVISFFPIFGSCSTSFRAIPKPLLACISICKGSFWKGMLHIKIPFAMPSIISAAKIGFTLSVMGAVVAEFIQPDKGIGHILLISQSNFDMNSIYICIAMLILQGSAIYGILSFIEDRLIKRRR